MKNKIAQLKTKTQTTTLETPKYRYQIKGYRFINKEMQVDLEDRQEHLIHHFPILALANQSLLIQMMSPMDAYALGFCVREQQLVNEVS